MKKFARVGIVTAILAVLCLAMVGCKPIVTESVVGDFGHVVYKNETMTVTLDANPTTGYEWNCEVTQGDKCFETTSNGFVQPEEGATDEEVVGAGGSQVYVFTALQPGDICMEFTYSRPGDPQPGDKHFTLRTVVTDKIKFDTFSTKI